MLSLIYTKGKRMSNFIEDLDEKYRKERKKNDIRKEDKTFVCNIPFRVKLYGNVNKNYIIRKGKLTRFLYIKKCLFQVFIQTIEEKTGENFERCSIHAQMNIKRMYISGIIGMCLYLFQAAGFIDIVKAEDYMESNKVRITRKMVIYHDGTKHFFYEKYGDCIECAIDTQIV